MDVVTRSINEMTFKTISWRIILIIIRSPATHACIVCISADLSEYIIILEGSKDCKDNSNNDDYALTHSHTRAWVFCIYLRERESDGMRVRIKYVCTHIIIYTRECVAIITIFITNNIMCACVSGVLVKIINY